ncbi:MAG TPA: tetratricopeptide repeat-containing serine protease family protein [Dissulfurispiraceae bacterium]|nr:tetratricopeptide repeat-containing serine protease family protein [Dissulfurispiraceae bacterium]
MVSTALLLFFVLSSVVSCRDAAAGPFPPASGQSASVLRITVRDSHDSEIASGNGFVVDARGIIAAPYHLVARWIGTSQPRLSLMTADGSLLEAQDLVTADEGHDLALVRLKSEGLPAVRFAAKPRVRKGERLVAFDLSGGGKPVPLEGVVQAMEKDGLLKISISLTPGNEGTPLFDKNGDVAGTAVVTGAAQQEGSLTVALPASILSGMVRAWREYERGRALGEGGRTKEALEAFRRAIQLRPEYADAHYALGVTLSRIGNYAEALDAYANAVRLMPRHLNSLLYLGKTYTVLGKHGDAIDTYLKLLELAPDYVEAYVLLGYSYQEKGMNHSAIKAYEDAIRINPDFVDAYLMLGGLYVKNGNYAEGLKLCKRAVEIQPEHAEARFRLGMLYLLVNNRDAAMDEYRKLQTLDGAMAEQLLAEIKALGPRN